MITFKWRIWFMMHVSSNYLLTLNKLNHIKEYTVHAIVLMHSSDLYQTEPHELRTVA